MKDHSLCDEIARLRKRDRIAIAHNERVTGHLKRLAAAIGMGPCDEGELVEAVLRRLALEPATLKAREISDLRADNEPQPAASKELLEHALEDLESLCDYAYDEGFHELGYDPLKMVKDQIERLSILEGEYAIFRKCAAADVEHLQRENEKLFEQRSALTAHIRAAHEPQPAASKEQLHAHAMAVLECANWMHECGYRTRGQQLESAAKALSDAAVAAHALLREARPYVESFARMTAMPAARQDALKLVERMHACSTAPQETEHPPATHGRQRLGEIPAATLTVGERPQYYCKNCDCPSCGNTRAVPPPVLARPRDEWHEDDGPVLWWKFPIHEPPYCGTPLDDDWIQHEYDGYYTHWTPVEVPAWCSCCERPSSETK